MTSDPDGRAPRKPGLLRWLLILPLGLLLTTALLLVRLGPPDLPIMPLGDASGLWVSRGFLVFLLPVLGGGCAILSLLVARFRRLGFVLLVGLAALQVAIPSRDVVEWLKHRRDPKEIYYSRREYVQIEAVPAGWADPARAEELDLGAGVRLAMSTVCYADAERRTLPTAVAPASMVAGEQPPRPLDERGRLNLVAFSRALGYLRYFHPTDAGTEADWDFLARQGVLIVEDSIDPADLARRLRQVFAPVAPTVRFLVEGEAAPGFPALAEARYLVRWLHHGAGRSHIPVRLPDDRAGRLATVAIAWNVFQHFYPYFDEVTVDWSGELPRALEAAGRDPDRAAFLATLRRLVAALKDGHARVWTGSPGLVPALDLTMVDGRPRVVATDREAREIPLGSEILSVDGEAAGTRAARLREEISAATSGWMERRVAKEFLLGGSAPLELVYRDPSGRIGHLRVQRVRSPSQPLETERPPASEVRPGVWLLDLARLDPEAFRSRLAELQKARAILFDARGYPRGRTVPDEILPRLASGLLQSARWNVPIFTRPDRRDWTWDVRGRWRIAPRRPRLKARAVFLIGGGAISYAESCLAIVEHDRLGDLVGEPTAGTNGNVTGFPLAYGAEVTWTGMRVLKHDGSAHHGVGILPTRKVSPTAAGLAAGRDEVLEAALDLVRDRDH